MPWANGATVVSEGRGNGGLAHNEKVQQIEVDIEERTKLVDHKHSTRSMQLSKGRRRPSI